MAAAEVPPIMDINTAREYLGGISRAHLYRIMPSLEQVHLGSRVFVTRSSCDLLIERNRRQPADEPLAAAV